MPLKFQPLTLPGLLLVTPRVFEDPRGAFFETWRADEFRNAGVADFVQDNHAVTGKRGVLRGLHFQRDPHAQAKLVRCVRGAIWDAVVDLRPGSATRGRWEGRELSDRNREMLYVPRGFAHGYVTLTDDAEVLYRVDAPYCREAEGGLAWNDPAVGIRWPIAAPDLNERDRTWPAFS